MKVSSSTAILIGVRTVGLSKRSPNIPARVQSRFALRLVSRFSLLCNRFSLCLVKWSAFAPQHTVCVSAFSVSHSSAKTPFAIMGETKATNFFTVDRLWLGYYFVLSCLMSSSASSLCKLIVSQHILHLLIVLAHIQLLNWFSATISCTVFNLSAGKPVIFLPILLQDCP